MIVLTSPNGDNVHFNPARIVMVERHEDGGSFVLTTAGIGRRVKEAPDVVARSAMRALGQENS